MAVTKSQIQTFIEQIAPCAQNGFKKYGKVYPSICIAMACVESAYGTAGSVKYHSYLGQKVGSGKTATKDWSGKFFKSKTKEEYQIGLHTVITDAFRAYDSMQQCVYNYYELLNTSIYKRVTSGVGYRTQMQQIKECGYMISSTEVNSVITIIEKYGLAKYDSEIPAAPVQKDMPVLKLGSRGEHVIAWQTLLSIQRYYRGAIDGIFGNETLSAVKEYQKAHNLTADGIIGAKTWATV